VLAFTRLFQFQIVLLAIKSIEVAKGSLHAGPHEMLGGYLGSLAHGATLVATGREQ
jgi:hypothetical protein